MRPIIFICSSDRIFMLHGSHDISDTDMKLYVYTCMKLIFASNFVMYCMIIWVRTTFISIKSTHHLVLVLKSYYRGYPRLPLDLLSKLKQPFECYTKVL